MTRLRPLVIDVAAIVGESATALKSWWSTSKEGIGRTRNGERANAHQFAKGGKLNSDGYCNADVHLWQADVSEFPG